MKFHQTSIMSLALCSLLALAVPSAWGKSPAGGALSCGVSNAGGGAIALNATVSVHVTSGVDTFAPQDIDVLARVTKGGAIGFFRTHLVTNINGLTNEEVACRLFNPNDTGDAALQAVVADFVEDILGYFGIQTTRQIKITDKSVSDAEIDPAIAAVLFPGTMNSGSLGDVKIYAQ